MLNECAASPEGLSLTPPIKVALRRRVFDQRISELASLYCGAPLRCLGSRIARAIAIVAFARGVSPANVLASSTER